jgi:hypothetical protein
MSFAHHPQMLHALAFAALAATTLGAPATPDADG